MSSNRNYWVDLAKSEALKTERRADQYTNELMTIYQEAAGNFLQLFWTRCSVRARGALWLKMHNEFGMVLPTWNLEMIFSSGLLLKRHNLHNI